MSPEMAAFLEGARRAATSSGSSIGSPMPRHLADADYNELISLGEAQPNAELLDTLGSLACECLPAGSMTIAMMKEKNGFAEIYVTSFHDDHGVGQQNCSDELRYILHNIARCLPELHMSPSSTYNPSLVLSGSY